MINVFEYITYRYIITLLISKVILGDGSRLNMSVCKFSYNNVRIWLAHQVTGSHAPVMEQTGRNKGGAEDGLLHTGDAGLMDEEGYAKFLGRTRAHQVIRFRRISR
jgi:acyl-CoA synthetase (AMP-forming)/AMP-acid ligase II